VKHSKDVIYLHSLYPLLDAGKVSSSFWLTLIPVLKSSDLCERNEHLSMPEKFASSLASVNVNIENNIVDPRIAEEIVDPPAQIHEDCITKSKHTWIITKIVAK